METVVVIVLLEAINRVARYKMFLTKHFCLLLEFYIPPRNMRGKRAQTN